MAKENNLWFPFYMADFLTDINVQMLSLDEEACYVRLLIYCYKEGSIPDDDKQLSRLCKGANLELISAVKGFFIPKGEGRLTHKRVEQEIEKKNNIATVRSTVGKDGAKKRWSKRQNDSNCHPFATDLPMAKNSHTHIHTHTQSCITNPPTHSEIKQYFYQQRKLGWSDGRCTIEATNFLDHYEAIGWITKQGQPIVNWQAQVRKWIKNDREESATPQSSIKMVS